MDLKIENKDTVLTKCGIPETISATAQVIQQIELALTIPRGSFAYCREMGIFEGEYIKEPETLELLINEALVNTKASVNVYEVNEQDGRIKVRLTLFDGFAWENKEVIAGG